MATKGNRNDPQRPSSRREFLRAALAGTAASRSSAAPRAVGSRSHQEHAERLVDILRRYGSELGDVRHLG